MRVPFGRTDTAGPGPGRYGVKRGCWGDEYRVDQRPRTDEHTYVGGRGGEEGEREASGVSRAQVRGSG